LSRLILLLLSLALVLYFYYRYKRLSVAAKKQSQRLMMLAIGVSVLVALVLTGKLSWIIAAIGALLPLIPRGARLFLGLWPTLKPYFQRYQQNHQSNMKSRYVCLQIDMLSGELRGEILAGEFAGRELQTLTLDELLQLLKKYKQDDAESAALVMAYLDRKHAGWVEHGGDGFKQGDSNFSMNSPMEIQQARDILGVSTLATKKEIIKAHKRLMQKLHPDRGGTDYLAQQINKARDILLKNTD